ncbi:MFS transporter [Pseudorhodoferax aquiterrae]|uniref:MFS transporter n=1 Tax=Pseudorhodoferax aquiterrae TaxID=747304 RepID=A0ABQ3FW28_9BURK|nr:MFS transporter [Pseudorhodoferax aquiterrae]GHC70942.1 MFS transporter [Pseudorhodoferax aquiterrae]
MSATPLPHNPSIWATLRYPQFRALWSSGGIYFIGNAMQTMAGAWMMVELTGSSFLAALVQTAVFLPMFLLSLPAGVLADITDRRRLILTALVVQAVAGTLMAVLLLAGIGGPGTLLFMIFVAGCCTALLSPAWNSTIADSVTRADLPQAITCVSIAYNAARAVGPALAGLVFTAVGGAWNFALAVVAVVVMALAIRRYPPKPHPPSRLPAERLWGGMMAALRFAWHSQTVLAQLVRTVAYSGAGSALWALLPTIGAQKLGLGATGYGMLMGCLGTGAVLIGLVVGQLRHRVGLEKLVAIGCVVYAVVNLIAAFAPWPALVYLALVAGGAAWMAVMSTFNTATQTSVPPWVRSRAVAMHTLCALGSFALGSAFWGAMADIAGLTFTLVVAAAAMAAGLLLGKPFPLRMGEAQEVTQTTPWDELYVSKEPAPEAGPVAIEIGYRIRAEDASAFLEATSLLRAHRKRDGATFWRVYRDLADPSRYVERFIVSSWADYLHQRARHTQADHELEAQVRAFVLPGEAVEMKHYLAEA